MKPPGTEEPILKATWNATLEAIQENEMRTPRDAASDDAARDITPPRARTPSSPATATAGAGWLTADLITVGLLTLTLLFTLALLSGCGGEPELPPRSPEDAVVRAALGTAERRNVSRRVEIQGTVEADKTANVSARVMAQVTAVHVAGGDRVRRGQVLLEIDPQSSRGQVSQARGGLAQAEAQLALAERNYERFQALTEDHAASQLELDQARTRYEQARGAVEQARGAVSSASAVASDTTVRAPFDGRVVRRMVEEGDLAAPGRPLLMLESDAGRRLDLSVPESLVSLAGLRIGDRVPVRIDTRPQLGTVEGAIVEMTPGADPLSHSFQVKVELPAVPDGSIPTGVAGRGFLPGAVRSAVVVPRDAILEQGGMELVVVRGDDGRARTRVVTTGEVLAERVEILSGLSGGETVLRGLPAVPPSGARVEEAEVPSRPAEIRPLEGQIEATPAEEPQDEPRPRDGGAEQPGEEGEA